MSHPDFKFDFELDGSGVTLRPECDADDQFLRRLYSSTRYDIDQAPLAEEMKKLLKLQQFALQKKHYREHFPNANFQVICQDTEPIGRLYFDARQEEVRLIDIALLPESRGQGIGAVLLTKLAKFANEQSLPLRLRVECDNRARQLYQRMGFRILKDEQTHWHMELMGPATVPSIPIS